jgi:hypothetical protein
LLRSASLAAVLALAGCPGDSTGPAHPQLARVALAPVFQTRSALLVSFNRVRVTLRRSTGTALDTLVGFPSGADSVVLTLLVPISGNSETLTLDLMLINAAGDTVFRGGPVPVVATTGLIGRGTAVNVAVRYAGVGANAGGVRIATRTASVFFRDSVQLTASALDSSGAPIPGTPIVWRSLDPTLATVPVDSTGKVIAGSTRGAARIEASLLTGQADTAPVSVQPLAAALSLVSGGGQTGTVGTLLALPMVARVKAADSLPVRSVYVHFAATSGGGAPSADSVLTDSLGLAQVQWTLGPTAGTQTLEATLPGVAGATVTFAASAVAATPKTLAFIASPTPAIAGVPIAPAVTVSALDSLGNTATSFTGTVTVAITAGTGKTGAALRGAKTVAAVAGTATFSDLSIDSAATGYTLTASSTGLPNATSAAFAIAPGPPAALTFALEPPTNAVYQTPFAIVVAAKDSIGNLAPGLAGTVTVALGTNPAGGTLTGTLTQTASGVATFSNLALDNIGSGYTLVVNSSGLSSATSSAVNIVAPPGWNAWVNTAGGSWSVATNWSKGAVPVATDSVAIKQSGTYTVSLAATATCARLDVGAPLGSDTLDLVRFAISVAGNFQTLGTGVLKMTSPTAALTVGGNVAFGGGSTAGTLTTGLITLGGNFAQTGTGAVFAPSGTHRVSFARSVTGTQTIQFADPVGSFFWDLMLNRPGVDTVRLLSDVQVQDSAIVTGSSVLASTALQALRTPAAGVVRVHTGGVLRPSRVEFGTLVADSDFTGSGPTRVLPDTAVFLNGGTITSTLPAYGWKSVRLAGGTLTSSGTTFNGNLIISGGVYSSALFGTTDSIAGFLRTEGSGVFQMPTGTQGATVAVRDSAVFGGGSEVGQLTQGTLRLYGNFVQRGSTTSFQASGTHLTQFAGATRDSITFANPGASLSTFNDVLLSRVSGTQATSVSLGSAVFVAGVLSDTSAAVADTIVGNGNTLTTGGFNLNDTYISNAPVVVPSGTLTLTGNVVTFANMSPTAVQLAFTRGTGVTLNAFAFLVTPTGAGKYFSVTSTAVSGPATFNFSNPVQPTTAPTSTQYAKSGLLNLLWGNFTL